jgi:hypothetical protein
MAASSTPTPFATGGRYVLRVAAVTGHTLYPGEHTGPDPTGHWLHAFDPEYGGGRGIADFTNDPAKAARFPSKQAAMACWQYRSRSRPTRPDGRPNKPLTAYTCVVEPAPGEVPGA